MFFGVLLLGERWKEGSVLYHKQVDTKLQVNGKLVESMMETNVFLPSAQAALSARAPKESDHEVGFVVRGNVIASRTLTDRNGVQKLRSTLRQCARDWTETVSC